MPATKTHQLQLVRTFNATPEEVYAAWTSPEAIKVFFKPGNDFTMGRVDMDVRVGGYYTIQMLSKEGKPHTATGMFRDVVPNKKLVYTWNRLDGNDCGGNSAEEGGLKDTLITIEFRPKGSGTEMVFTHDLFPNDTSRDAHNKGWTAILDQFVRYHA